MVRRRLLCVSPARWLRLPGRAVDCCVAVVCVIAVLPPSLVHTAEPRDPFMFGPRAEGVQPSGPALIGVLWDATQPLAMVGEETVAVGGRVDGWQVIEIQPDGIVIQRADRREFLTPGTPFPID